MRIPSGARRQRITGSQVYGFFKCEHLVYLDFYADEAQKLPPGPELAHLFERGKAHERDVVARLHYPEPSYPQGDYEEGARRTLELLRQGVPGVQQGVLYHPPYLGIPDLLRRAPGESALGDFHYVVGDIKSSFTSRSDQALQVTFYSHLLAGAQGRVPERGFLVLRDHREEEVDVSALTLTLVEILEEMEAHVAHEGASRPHRSFACRDCGWRALCAASPDVYWVPGLTRAVQSLLDRAGYRSLDALSRVEPRERARDALLPEATWQKARSGAAALLAGRALPVRSPRLADLVGRGRPVVILRDPFDQRFPAFASLDPSGLRLPRVHLALRPEDEEEAFRGFLSDLSGDESLCHSGGFSGSLYHFAQRLLHLSPDVRSAESRGLNLMSIVRGAYAFPAPVRIPEEALAWIEGAPLEAAGDVALLLAAEDEAGLRERAESELRALDRLLERLRAFP